MLKTQHSIVNLCWKCYYKTGLLLGWAVTYIIVFHQGKSPCCIQVPSLPRPLFSEQSSLIFFWSRWRRMLGMNFNLFFQVFSRRSLQHHLLHDSGWPGWEVRQDLGSRRERVRIPATFNTRIYSKNTVWYKNADLFLLPFQESSIGSRNTS